MPSGDSAARGRASSVHLLGVGIAKAKAWLRVMATTQAWCIGFWQSGAPVLRAEQVPDGEQSPPGFYSPPLFSHHSWE